MVKKPVVKPKPDPSEPNYWFKAKKYGWGWYPASREGWLVTGVGIILYFFAFTHATKSMDANPAIGWSWYGVCIALILGLILICYRTGEPPRWRWGK